MNNEGFELSFFNDSPKLPFLLTILVILLVAGVSIISLRYAPLIYPEPEIMQAYYPSDMINLVIGLPLLLVTLFLVRQGRLAGLLCWPGALFYMFYTYSLYLLGVPFGMLFPAYLLIVGLSVYTMAAILAGMDLAKIQTHFHQHVPKKFAGGVLLALAVMLMIRVAVLIITALANNTAVSQTDLTLWLVDFLIAGPPLGIIGLLIWQGGKLGYAAAPGLLLQYGLLSLSLVPVLLMQANMNAQPVDTAGVMIVLLMAALCLMPFGFFMRTASRIDTADWMEK